MAHQLPELGFSRDALQPHISAETLDYHYGKHHATYVEKLNGLIAGTEFENASLEETVKRSSGGIFNNAAQHWNHSFYWKVMTPGGADAPQGELSKAIDAAFGSFDGFKKQFSEKSATLFGSGWCWLVKNSSGGLEILQTSNADCPLTTGQTPLMVIDVWEHAYYVDYRNARPKYIDAFWNVVNWTFVGENYAS